MVELVLRLRKELTEQGLDAGADTIGWHLHHHRQVKLSRATINRILVRNGTVIPDPAKRPRSSYIRFESAMPNECSQSDFTHYWLTTAIGAKTHAGTGAGADVEILTWLDDHSRYALHLSAHVRVTARIVLDTFSRTAGQHEYLVSTLTDNAMVYTTRFAGGRGGRKPPRVRARRLHIVQKNPERRQPELGPVQGLDLGLRAPRGAALPDGGGRTPSPVCRVRVRR
ncbi:hypothetical protein ACFPJ1_38865 [Kribbella qitaiheensis]|uniref:hypothetical protein n=1 Tax=Kribbella qitaiheensis TaxID=1544730 RepID=UPI003614A796